MIAGEIILGAALMLGVTGAATAATQAPDPQPTTCRQARERNAGAETRKEQRKTPQARCTRRYMLM